MPRISDTIAINNEKLDRRVKLTADDKKLIVRVLAVRWQFQDRK
jgi:hypothetical protein